MIETRVGIWNPDVFRLRTIDGVTEDHPAQRQIHRGDRGSSRTSGVIFNLLIIGSISIEIDRHLKTREMFG
jgi:hypothetical protein